MFGQTAVGSAANSPSGSRMFRYEVTGLRQNNETDRNNYSIRRSGSVFITVPYNRMNEEMQRILRMGGRIVSIQPVGSETETSSSSSNGKQKQEAE
jgi:phycocyanin-associated rod protein